MRNWTAAVVTIILAAFCIMVLSAISAERWKQVDQVAPAEITAEEQERREQAAYYKGWQDGKQYYLDEFGGEPMTVKDYYETIRDIDRLAAVVDAEGAVTLDYDDAEQIWALLLDYKDLLMAVEVG